VLQNGELVTQDMLPALLNSMEGTKSVESDRQLPAASNTPLSIESIKPLWMIEKDAIEGAIAVCDGNIPRAAALLEVSPSTIYRKRLGWQEE
jgi:transcriptional regulator of acetoin/glycerol metabolism